MSDLVEMNLNLEPYVIDTWNACPEVGEPVQLSVQVGLSGSGPAPWDAIMWTGTPIEELETMVVHRMREDLDSRPSVDRRGEDDNLFSTFWWCYSLQGCQQGLSVRVTALWERYLRPILEQAAAKLSAANPGFGIHKGAIYFNVGLCYFASGDFEKAHQYVAAAGEEDDRLGRGDQGGLALGEGLADQVLQPLITWVASSLGANYQLCTGMKMDGAELQGLIRWLGRTNLADAMQLLTALQRFRALSGGPQSSVSAHQAARAVADLLLVIESVLRRLQSATAKDKFDSIADALLQANSDAVTAYRWFRKDHDQAAASQRATGFDSASWALTEAPVRWNNAITAGQRVGIIFLLAVKLRNQLMHALDERSSIYTNPALPLWLLGSMVGLIRVLKHSADGTLPGL